MEHTLVQPPEVLKLAGHAVRWNLLTSLARALSLHREQCALANG